MRARKTKSLISCTCEICGKTFYASRPSKTCIDNSTCRVIKHQRAKEQQRIAKEFMMDMESYQSYLTLVERYPHLKESVDMFILSTDATIGARAIAIMWQVALAESQRAVNVNGVNYTIEGRGQ